MNLVLIIMLIVLSGCPRAILPPEKVVVEIPVFQILDSGNKEIIVKIPTIEKGVYCFSLTYTLSGDEQKNENFIIEGNSSLGLLSTEVPDSGGREMKLSTTIEVPRRVKTFLKIIHSGPFETEESVHLNKITIKEKTGK